MPHHSRVLRFHAAALLTLLTLLAALPLGAQTPTPSEALQVVLLDGFGTPSSFHLSGRVLRAGGHLPDLKGALPSSLSGAGSLLDALDTDEAEGVPVELTVGGTRYTVHTDDDGVFALSAAGLAVPLPQGPVAVHARIGALPAVEAVLHIVPWDCRVVLISDWDDTVVQTHVASPGRMVVAQLTTEATAHPPVAGVAAAYQRALSAGACLTVYLSGSPVNLQPRLRALMDKVGLPRGPLLLKNLGADSATEQSAYKLRRLQQLAAAIPHVRFVLLGDDGESDPEIYDGFRRSAPSRVAAVVIRNTTGSLSAARVPQMVTLRDYQDNPDVLAALVRGALTVPPAPSAAPPADPGHPAH